MHCMVEGRRVAPLHVAPSTAFGGSPPRAGEE
jgi:hypothetical protein